MYPPPSYRSGPPYRPGRLSRVEQQPPGHLDQGQVGEHERGDGEQEWYRQRGES
jgi:hypothetical protein